MAGGSIKRDGNGWMFVVDVASPDGERRQVRRRGFDTKKAAEKELRSVLGLAESGLYVEPTRLTVGRFLTETWLPSIVTRVRPTTGDMYRRIVDKHVVPALGTHAFWMQVLPGSQWLNAPLTAVHVPRAPLVSHRSHEPVHAVAQQTPSTQNPLSQSALCRHALPVPIGVKISPLALPVTMTSPLLIAVAVWSACGRTIGEPVFQLFVASS